jgi:uncharacterized metal-binding protein YceD (DUF177 family)
MTALARWHHKVHEIPRAGISELREAGDDLRQAIAKELRVPACRKLIADYVVKNAGAGRFQLKGTLTAEFERECVLTLEPLTESLKEPLDCLFVPPELIPQHQSEEEEAHAVEEIEPITSQDIEVGRIIYEVIAAALNPYPRASDAALALPASNAVDETRENPFAVLKNLTDDRDAES